MLLGFVLIAAGCKTATPPPPADSSQPPTVSTTPSASPVAQAGVPVVPAEATAAKPRVDACALLSREEIQAVQGETVRETKLSGQPA